MTENKIIVIEKDGISYIKIVYNRNLLINGNILNLCPGNDNWAMIEGKVEKIEQILQTPTRVIGFKLKDEFKGFGLSEILDLSTFEYDNEKYEYYGKNREFYDTIYSVPEIYYTPIEFIILDTDCEPENVPSYVVFDFPYDLKYNKEVQHKYPCHIPMPEVFNLVWDRIAEIVKDNPKYIMDNYKSIQTLTIKERIKIPWGEKRVVEFYPNIRSKKMKKEVREYFDKQVEILQIVGTYKKTGEDVIQIQEVRGKDYYDLMKNLEEYIQSMLSIFDDKKREVCSTCKGVGIIIGSHKG